MSDNGVPAVTKDVLLCCLLLTVCLLSAYVTKAAQFVYLNESGCAMLLGMLAGALARFFGRGTDLVFHPQVFFYGCLPLIIFQAGYSLKKKDFFRNFTSITLFAVVGTIISTLVYGLGVYILYKGGYVTHLSTRAPLLECLMFGSLISAIDPVSTLSIFQDVAAPTLLYNLVFGESLVNDAVSIVLFRTFESFISQEFSMSTIAVALVWFCVISVVSIVLGIIISLMFAVILKYIGNGGDTSKYQLAFILLSGYMSYAVAEMLSLSGIMSLFFCGICNGHYAYYNTSHSAQISSKYAFEALAFLAEVFVFAWCGMQVLLLDHVVDWGLLLSALPLCLISRAVNIFPLSWLANMGRDKPIPWNMTVMMWMCGLRGAVAYALAANMPTSNRALETTTLFIVVTTTIGFGGMTSPMLQWLGLTPKIGAERSDNLGAPLLGSLHAAGGGFVEFLRQESFGPATPDNRHTHGIHGSFKWLDAHYLKPLFGGRPVPEAEHQEGDDDRSGLIPVRGEGFTVHVPSDWIPITTEADDLVLTYVAPTLAPGGHHIADLVLYHGHCDCAGIESLGEPLPVLRIIWKFVGIGTLVGGRWGGWQQGSARAGNNHPPFFIMSMDAPRDALQNTTYRYELVINPGGESRWGGESQHALVSATVCHNLLFVCKVQGSEKWWLSRGRSLARTIQNTLAVE